MAMKTSHSSSRQQQPQHQSGTVKHRHDDNADEDELDDKSQDSIDSPPVSSPRCLSRDEVLATLGYRSGSVAQQSTHQPQAQRSNACRRCGKKVYPLELIDIGGSYIYHRGCFKCYVREHLSRLSYVVVCFNKTKIGQAAKG